MSDGQQPLRMDVVASKARVSSAIMETRAANLAGQHLSAEAEDLRRAAGFENGCVGLRLRRKITEKERGGIADPRSQVAEEDRKVFSGLGGVTESALGITVSEETFMQSLNAAGLSPAAAEQAWNNLLLSRVETCGVAQGPIMAGDSGVSGSPFAVRGTMGIPCVTRVVAGDRLRFILPTKAQAAAVDAISPMAGRADEWSSLRRQLSVQPITRGNQMDRFFTAIAIHQKAPFLSRELLDMPSSTIEDAAPSITHAQGTMETFTCMLTALMLKWGVVFAPEENNSAADKIVNFTGTGHSPNAGNFAVSGVAAFADLHGALYQGASGYAKNGEAGTKLVSNAISQVPILTAMLMPTSETTTEGPVVTTEGHFADADAETQKRMAQLRTEIYATAIQFSIQNTRSNAEGGAEARPNIRDFPCTLYDRDTGTFKNPAMDATTMTFRNSKLGAAAAKMGAGVTKVAAATFMHIQEEQRFYAGRATGDCSPGGLVGLRLA